MMRKVKRVLPIHTKSNQSFLAAASSKAGAIPNSDLLLLARETTLPSFIYLFFLYDEVLTYFQLHFASVS